MKPSTIKKLFAFIATIILSVFILIFYNSCRKEASRETKKTNTALKASSALSPSIIYTDVNPDSTVKCLIASGYYSGSCSSKFNFDLNKDGINDFYIMDSARRFMPPGAGTYKTNTYVLIKPLNNNATFDTIENMGNIIDVKLKWSTVLETLASLTNTAGSCGGCHGPICPWCWKATIVKGSWSGQTDKYLPLKMIVGTSTYYGWARLDVASGGRSFTIKDYAYNSIPNQSILAGQIK